MDRGMKAAQLFESGYNCAQSVAVAFADILGMDEKTAARVVSGFGGGFGRLREVCGAFSGLVFGFSTLYGYDDPADNQGKMEQYKLIQSFAKEFSEAGAGSIVCREILKNPPSDPVPSERTEEYYRLRPCARMCYNAAHILQKYIDEHPIEE